MTEAENTPPATGPFRVGSDSVNQILCPALGIYPIFPIAGKHEAAVAYFASVPWCAALLAAPGAIAFSPNALQPQQPDFLQATSVTLANDRCLRHVLGLFVPEDASHATDPLRPARRLSLLWSLGPGITGYPGLVHGGIIMLVLDDSCARLHNLNSAIGKAGRIYETSMMTSGMDVQFLRPLSVGEFVVHVWLDRVDGRRSRVCAEIVDADGDVKVKALSKWVSLRKSGEVDLKL